MVDTIKIKLSKSLFFLFFLVGCSSPSPWHVSYLPGAQKEFDSARLIYPIHDRVNGLAVEIIYTKEQLRTYFVVHSQAIPPYQGNPKEALAILKTGDQTIRAIAFRHEGGQRISLPPKQQQFFIKTLLSGQDVAIQLQGYSTNVSAKHFKAEYDNLKKDPLNLPIQLPFKV
jgi:hypothetical protein